MWQPFRIVERFHDIGLGGGSVTAALFCIRTYEDEKSRRICEKATRKGAYLMLFIDKLLELLFTFVQNDDRII